MIEAKKKEEEGEGPPDWITGRDLARPSPGSPDLGRPVRNLKNPEAFLTHFGRPYPKKMSDFFHIQEDNGGVHINSTIIGHAFYLLAEGLNGAIGLLEAAERDFLPCADRIIWSRTRSLLTRGWLVFRPRKTSLSWDPDRGTERPS